MGAFAQIIGSTLTGLGEGYADIQHQKHLEQREDLKNQRDAAIRLITDPAASVAR